jgi:hypothetical protein
VAADVNLDRVRDLAGHLRDAVRQLRALAGSSAESFAADPRTANAAKYLLIVACEGRPRHLQSRRCPPGRPEPRGLRGLHDRARRARGLGADIDRRA